ncbi:histidine-histamine antiporter, partial [Enterobacter asburiae]
MGTVSSGSAHKMGVIALTLVTASNMMGSGVFMLPTNLAGIGSISIWGWVFTIIGVI